MIDHKQFESSGKASFKQLSLEDKLTFLNMVKACAKVDDVIALLDVLDITVTESDVRLALRDAGFTERMFHDLWVRSDRYGL